MQQQRTNACAAQEAAPLQTAAPGAAGRILPGYRWDGDQFTLRLNSDSTWAAWAASASGILETASWEDQDQSRAWWRQGGIAL